MAPALFTNPQYCSACTPVGDTAVKLVAMKAAETSPQRMSDPPCSLTPRSGAEIRCALLLLLT
jgi:hypothetical protein